MLSRKRRIFCTLVNLAIVLSLVTILLGAYTRLTDAGLGCPDWPGCYGQWRAPKQLEQIALAQEKFPHARIEPHKAHNEMLHRYIASLLGVALAVIFFLGQWLGRNRLLVTIILMLAIFQAALGMWTVTLNLLPLVVLAHLLGGFALLCLLVLLRLHSRVPLSVAAEPQLASLIPMAWLTLTILLLQISLGAWTSSNYAALACHQLPLCEAGWQERFSLAEAFHLPLGHESYQYGVLTYDARMSIHVLHRAGALVSAIVIIGFAVLLWRRSRNKIIRRLALLLLSLLVLQLCLGLINVLAYLPLLNAVAHNFVAANLLLALVVLIDLLYRVRREKYVEFYRHKIRTAVAIADKS